MQHALARPDHSSCVVHMCTFCDILWPEVQSHSDNSRMHTTGLCSAPALAQACPTMSCIRPVLHAPYRVTNRYRSTTGVCSHLPNILTWGILLSELRSWCHFENV